MNNDIIITIRFNDREKEWFDYCMANYNQRLTRTKSGFIKHLIYLAYLDTKYGRK